MSPMSKSTTDSVRTPAPEKPHQTDPPKVTVCVITYNQARYIGQCLQSLLDQQTDFAFEIVVGDDCSTDGTREIVQDFAARHPGRIRALLQPANTGGSRNNLEVHAAAVGEYVAHVDGDDYVLPGKLQAQADVLDRDSGCQAVWHRVDFFDDTGGFCPGESADWSSFRGRQVTFGDAIRLGFVSVYSSLMYRRAARTPVDPGRRVLDLHLTWDLLSKGHGRVVDQVLARYRIASSGSLTVATRPAVRLLTIEHAKEFLARHPGHARDFAVWALSNALVDARNRRTTWRDLVAFAWRTRAIVGPWAILANLRRMRATQVKWSTQRRFGAPGR